MKLCINCKHHEVFEYNASEPEAHYCNQRIHPVLGLVNPVTCYGNRTTVDPVLGLACGPEGKFYEEPELIIKGG